MIINSNVLFCLPEPKIVKKPKSGLFSKFRYSLRKSGSKKNVRMPTDELTTASSQCIYTNAPNTNRGANHVISLSYPISSNSSLRRRSYLIAIDQNKSNELLERSVKPSGVMYTVEDDDLESNVNPSSVTYTAETAGNYFGTHEDGIRFHPIPAAVFG